MRARLSRVYRVLAAFAGLMLATGVLASPHASAVTCGPAGGNANALSDFNNDGFSDLAIGVPLEALGSLTSAGMVNVIYGRQCGLSDTAANGTSNDQPWDQDQNGMDGSAEASDTFGLAIATGDFDGNGYADLAVGVPGEDVGTIVNAGAVSVIYGSSSGLSAVVPPGTRVDQLWTQDSPNIDDMAEANDNFGKTLVVGDFNGDPYDDVAIGVPNEDGTAVDGGAVSIIFGSSAGLSATTQGSTGHADQVVLQSNAGGSVDANDRFGSALAAGDFDADTRDDLAIGSPADDLGVNATGATIDTGTGKTDAGVVNVFRGTTGTTTLVGVSKVFTQGPVSGAGLDVIEGGDQFGAALAVGDFTGDGKDDLAVSSPVEDVGPIVDAGAVTIINGPNVTTPPVVTGDQVWTQSTQDVEGVAETGDAFGWSLAAGNFDGSGPEDLAVGVTSENYRIDNDGAVNVLYGVSGGLTAVNDQLLAQAPGPGSQDGAVAQPDALGYAVMTADFNGDSKSDIAAGAPFEDIGANTDAGGTNVWHGGGSSGAFTVPATTLWHQDVGTIDGSAEPNDRLGNVLGRAGP